MQETHHDRCIFFYINTTIQNRSQAVVTAAVMFASIGLNKFYNFLIGFSYHNTV